MKRLFPIVLAALLLAGFGGEKASPSLPEATAPTQAVTQPYENTPADTAPAETEAPFVLTFSTQDREGNPWTQEDLGEYKGIILNFWEPWCGPCVAEMPFLEQLSQEYANKGVQVIGVFATPDADEEVQATLDKTGVTYPILRYVREFGALQTGYVPTTVVIDGTGAIVYGPVAGALNYAGWCALIEELL